MGLSKFKFWQRSDPFEGFPPLRPLVMMALPVLFAAFLGAGFGGLAGIMVIAGAPAIPAMPAAVFEPSIASVRTLIEVEPLDPLPRPALALTIPGAPHRPALYALLLSREADETQERVIAGVPHRLSTFAQLFWSYRLQEQPSERVITGPAHKPAELAGLYAQSLIDNADDGPVIPGAPHQPAEIVQAPLAPEPLEKKQRRHVGLG